jgi:hypothetical protein
MKLLATCSITSKEIKINGEIKLSIPANDIDWKKWVYNYLNLEYPKFHKMDSLAKLAFCGLNVLESEIDLSNYSDDEVGLIFANHSSSYYSDNNHFINYTQKNMVSPSDFVYTLPNILTGELAIYKKWYGENVFFIQEKFNPDLFLDHATFLFNKGIKTCMCGWVECNAEIEQAVLFLIQNKNGEIQKDELLNLI